MNADDLDRVMGYAAARRAGRPQDPGDVLATVPAEDELMTLALLDAVHRRHGRRRFDVRAFGRSRARMATERLMRDGGGGTG